MKVLITMLSLVILLSAYPALAEWSRGGLRGPGAEGGRLLEQLTNPNGATCHAGCGDTARTCRENADNTFLTSVNSPTRCQTQIQQAQQTCAMDRTSPDCQTARSALRSCAQPDLLTLRTNLRACRNAAETCGDACVSGQ
jgi:hypothetical protein